MEIILLILAQFLGILFIYLLVEYVKSTKIDSRWFTISNKFHETH